MNIKVGNIIKEKMLHSTGYLTWKWSHTIERQYSKCGLKCIQMMILIYLLDLWSKKFIMQRSFKFFYKKDCLETSR
jgi:hypothetical protein